MQQADLDRWHMQRALAMAGRGQGFVEPNPMVGCIIARGAEIVGEGWHRRFGGPHAEIETLTVAGARAAGATMYVTLEPCCHQGKTPPCTDAVIQAGIARVVIAGLDPFSDVDGRGVAALRTAGLEVEYGALEDEARRLNAPYLKLLTTGRPWVIAKWAMTADGKLATRSGESRWISGEASREIVHQIRGRVDAIVVGRRTAEQDDPLLTARPAGPRVATRVVLDSAASLSSDSQLVRTAGEAPVLVAASCDAPDEDRRRLASAGCEVLQCSGDSHAQRLTALLDELGRRRMTNVLVEGGSQVLGTLFDEHLVDEVHVFISPKLLGGAAASSPLGGEGRELMQHAVALEDVFTQIIGEDVYLRGRIPASDA